MNLLNFNESNFDLPQSAIPPMRLQREVRCSAFSTKRAREKFSTYGIKDYYKSGLGKEYTSEVNNAYLFVKNIHICALLTHVRTVGLRTGFFLQYGEQHKS